MSEKKSNDFNKILLKIVLDRIAKSKKKFKGIAESIAKNLAKSIYDEESKQTYDFLKALEECKNFAEINNTAEYLHECIFNNSKTCNKIRRNIVLDFETRYCSEWDRDHQNFRKEIKSILEKGKKDFIDIFWSSRRKIEYFYVGLTRLGSKRFEERKHDNAPVCSKEAEKLTIIYLKKNYLEHVEACIIRIFGLRPEKEPKKKFGIGRENEKLKYNSSYPFLPYEYELYKSYKQLEKSVRVFLRQKKEHYKSLLESKRLLEKLSNQEKKIKSLLKSV
ncbi:MAG: hypothetical protein LBC85_07185 [Fibromonadaceae bacterium]|jgi:hypothetical protein|nr:hypothetical protein [Fibromonadaceae bacterium]